MRCAFIRTLLVIVKLLLWFAEPRIEWIYLSCVFVVALWAVTASDDIALHLTLRLVVMTFSCVNCLLVVCLNYLVYVWGILPCAHIHICFGNAIVVLSLASVIV